MNEERKKKRSLGNPTNADCEKKSKLAADTNEVNIRIYLGNNLTELNQLTRNKLEEITIRTLCKLIKQHIATDELIHKLNEIEEKLASLQNKYNDLQSQNTQISCSKNDVLRTLQEPSTIQSYQMRRTVSVQVEQDAQVKPSVIFIDLTDEDESTSTNDATPLTAGSRQVFIAEDKEDRKIGKKPKESQKSVM